MDSVPRALVHCEKPVKQQKNTGTWLKPLEMWPESRAGSTHLLYVPRIYATEWT